MTTTRFNLGVWTTALVAAIQAGDARKVGRLCDAGRSAGLNYRDMADIACRAAKMEPAAWDALPTRPKETSDATDL